MKKKIEVQLRNLNDCEHFKEVGCIKDICTCYTSVDEAAEIAVLNNSDMRASYSMGKFGEEMFKLGAKWEAEKLSKEDAIQVLNKSIELLLKKQEKMYSEDELKSFGAFVRIEDRKPNRLLLTQDYFKLWLKKRKI